MKNVYLYRDHLPPLTQGSAVTIGNFDGIHLGHQGVLTHVVQKAKERSLVPTVLTFTPHAREFFSLLHKRPELAPTRILSIRDKITTLQSYGIERIVLKRFNAQFSSLSATDFIEQVLIGELKTKWLTVGEDFRFGHKRMGDVDLLRTLAPRYGFEFEPLPNINDARARRYSSTLLRQALALGQMDKAAALLGHPLHLSGRVIHGQKLGRQLGFPTLNLKMPQRSALRSGVYIVTVQGLSTPKIAGIASIGVRPTVTDNDQVLLEIHLLDCGPIDAYGQLIDVELLQFVRDEEKFPNLDVLIQAIEQDIAVARTYFSNHGL